MSEASDTPDINLDIDLTDFKQSLNTANELIEDMAMQANRALNSIGPSIASIGISLANNLILNFAKTASQLQLLSQATGESVATLNAWQEAINGNGVSVSDLNNIITTLGSRLQASGIMGATHFAGMNNTLKGSSDLLLALSNTLISNLSPNLANFGGSIEQLSLKLAKNQQVLTGMAYALAGVEGLFALTNPVNLALAGILALIAAFSVLYNDYQNFVKYGQGHSLFDWTTIQKVIDLLENVLGLLWNISKFAGLKLFDFVKDVNAKYNAMFGISDDSMNKIYGKLNKGLDYANKTVIQATSSIAVPPSLNPQSAINNHNNQSTSNHTVHINNLTLQVPPGESAKDHLNSFLSESATGIGYNYSSGRSN